jgi:tetratricopeptide (TPR) repeat protein
MDVTELETFPDEIWFDIFYFLDPDTLMNCSLVSRHFKTMAESNFVWNPLYDKLCKGKFTYWLTKNAPNYDRTKILYHHAIRDGKRTAVTKEELTSLGWIFQFKHNTQFQHKEIMHFPYFRADGRYFHEGIDFDQEFVWFLAKDSKSVQINHFPAHYFARQANWGWVMENMYVRFDSYCDFTDVDVENTYPKTLEYATAKKESGNSLFKKGENRLSIIEYQKGLSKISHKEWSEYKDVVKLIVLLLLNLSACYLKEGHYHHALIYSELALDRDKKNEKGLYRKALCLKHMGHDQEAQEVCELLTTYYPHDKTLKETIQKLLRK